LEIATTKNGEKKNSFYRGRWSNQELEETFHDVH
jgi:hypothetical protein